MVLVGQHSSSSRLKRVTQVRHKSQELVNEAFGPAEIAMKEVAAIKDTFHQAFAEEVSLRWLAASAATGALSL